MAEDISNLTARVNELKQMVSQIMVDTRIALIAPPRRETNDNSSNNKIAAFTETYMPLFYNELLRIASGVDMNISNSSNPKDSETEVFIANKTSDINDDTKEVRVLMSTLVDKQDAIAQQQDNYYSDLIDNTEAFVDNSEEDKKKGNILTRMMGTMKSAIGGFIGGLFAPKPKTVILAKASIKDIAGVFKAFSPENKASLKDKDKDKAASSIADAIANVITKVGNAVTKAIKGIQLALEIFIYVIFPLVLLGAVALLVVGLYFIAKMIMDTLGQAIAEALGKIAGSIETLANSVAGVVDQIGNIVGAISNVINGVVDGVTTAMKVIGEGIAEAVKGIANVITTIGNKVSGIIDDIWGAIKSISKSVVEFLSPSNLASKAVSGVKSFFSGSDEKAESPAQQDPFKQITEPICTAVNDFNSMVKSYLSNLKIAAVTSVIRTNVVGDTRLNSFQNNNSNSNSSNNQNNNSYSQMNNSSRSSNNTSTPADGTSNNSFNNAMLNKYSYEYSNNTMNNSNRNSNEEVVRQIKETNSLMLKLIELLTPKGGNSFSMVGD